MARSGNPSRRTSRRERAEPSYGTTLAAALSVISTASALAISYAQLRLNSVFLLLLIATLLALFVTFISFLRTLRTSVVEIRANIALAGAPGVGKTVLANILASRLSEGGVYGLRFTPEARTAQHVYRTIRNLFSGEWPPSTESEMITHYRGDVFIDPHLIRKRSLLQPLTLPRRRIVYQLDVADSAGENWERLASEHRGDNSPGLLETTYFQYIGEESDALFYLVSAETLISDSQLLSTYALDLTSTVALLATISPDALQNRLPRPVALLVSKADVLSETEQVAVRRLFESGSVAFSTEGLHLRSDEESVYSEEFISSLRILEQVMATLTRQAERSKCFLVSAVSAQGLSLGHRAGLGFTSEPADRPAHLDEVGEPLRWALSHL